MGSYSNPKGVSDFTDLREKIINTALGLFEKHGFHSVPVHEIVRESGTSKGGFYHYFHSKEELLYVIHDYFISYVLEKAEIAMSMNATPTEKLQKMILSFVKVFDLYKPHITVFYQESTYLKSPYAEAIHEKRQKYKRMLFSLIEEGIEQGEFRPEMNVKIIGMSILGMVNWTYKWFQRDGEKTIEEISDMFVDFVLHSLLTEQAKSDPRYENYFLKNQTASM